VVAAVRAELNAAPAAAERPGLAAAPLALAAILDDPTCGGPAGSRASTRRDFEQAFEADAALGKLAMVKSMTTSGHSAD
jgi:hypothetical protein